METFVERCAGLDVSARDVKACVRVPGPDGGRRQEVRTFDSTTRGLLRLRDWLLTHKVTVAGMESTGVYWKPVFYLLEADLECWLLNPQHLKAVPGRKSDVADAVWIAQLVEHGLVRPSFVPPPPIRELRDLTRYRASLIHERTREVQRLHKVLEDAGIKLGNVATDILGVSGREMLAKLIAGERDPRVLAESARARMRPKIPALVEALHGQFRDHHARLCRMMLAHIDELSAAVTELDTAIDAAMTPFRPVQRRLRSIPGVGVRTSQVIIAEIGVDMTRFRTSAHLSSWAGMCPGLNQSGQRHLSTRTRNGDSWLRAALGECATAAGRTKGTRLADRHRALTRRRGAMRAKVATGRVILESCWYVITHDVDYTDPPPHHRTAEEKRRAQRLAHQLRAMGYPVTLPDPVPHPTPSTSPERG